VVIRRCRSPRDFVLADELDRACGPANGPAPSKFNEARMAAWLSFAEGGVSSSAEYFGKRPEPVAFAAAYITEDGAVCLATCGVLPGYRGRGLQRKLVRTVHAWGRKRGVTRASTYTAADNWPSLSALMRCGYRVVGYRHDEAASGDGFVDVECKL
jgi:GNAT superfamily N-acetyltransferase